MVKNAAPIRVKKQRQPDFRYGATRTMNGRAAVPSTLMPPMELDMEFMGQLGRVEIALVGVEIFQIKE